jgi:hypothetical protein
MAKQMRQQFHNVNLANTPSILPDTAVEAREMILEGCAQDSVSGGLTS